MFPERPQLVLASDIPDCEFDVFVLEGLDVEPDGRDGLDELVLLQLEEDRRLAGSVQSQGYNSHLDFGSDVDSIILKKYLC